ncbi:MAG: hypothetical protein AB1798_20005 [Spirochaetota bacterium]
MRTVAKGILVSLICASLALTGMAQQQTIGFKKLQEFLPKIDLSGYSKGKPGGQTSKAMGMSVSEATLRYEKSEGDIEISIEIKIQDTAGVPFLSMGLGMIGSTEFENETEDGYEKSVKIQGHPGTEKVQRGEYKSAEVTIAVASRFLIELKCHECDDVGSLRKLADSMDLNGLAKLAQ